MDLRGFGRRLELPQEDPRQQMSQQMTQQQGGGFQPSAFIAEGGGLGGALAGGATGAAIGSVVPGIGTVIGGLIGAGLGGFLGGTGGSAVEQKVRDNRVDMKKALKFGAAEGVMSAGPLKLIKGGYAGYKALRAGEAARPAIEETLNNTLLKRMTNRAGKGLETTGGRLLNSQTNLTRATIRQIGVNTPDMFLQMNNRYGLSKLDDVAAVAQNVTGKDGVHSEAVRNVLFSGPGIKTDDLNGELAQLLDAKAPLLDTGIRKRIQAQVYHSIQSMSADQPLNPLGNPGMAFDIANDFRSQARQLRRGAAPSGADKQLAEVYDGLARNIEKKLYSQPGLDKVFPEVRDNMARTYMALAQRATGAQAKAYRRLAEEAGSMKTVTDMRKAQKIWVEAAQVEQKTAEAAGNAATKLGGGGGIISRVVGTAADAASPYAGKAAIATGGVVRRSSDLLARMNNTGTRALTGAFAANSTEPQQPIDPLSQLNVGGRDGSPQDLMAQGGAVSSPQDLMAGEDASAFLLGQSQQAAPEGGPEYYLAGAQRAAAVGDFENAQKLMEMAGAVSSITGAGTKLSATQQKGVLAMQNAMVQVDQLEQLFTQAGGGQNRVGGAVSGLLGRVGFNDAAQAYRQKRAGAATIIARALGESGTMTDQDIQRAVSQIPDITDTPGEAQIKWQAIKQLLSEIGQNSLSVGPAASGDLLTQMNGL